MNNMNEEIKNACDVLMSGGLILYPTDTIWGIGCDATNAAAVKKVYELKKRDDSKSLIVLLDNAVKLDYYINRVPEIAWDLIEVSDKPMTIVYDNARNIAPNLIAEDGSIGIRITNETFSNALCKRFRKALVSTSANISGESSPRNFNEISDDIKKGVDYIVNFRQDEMINHKSSSIIKLGESGQVTIIRD